MARRHATYKKFPPLLKKMREDADLSQRALSRKLRKPPTWVFRTETDRRRIDVLEFVAWAVACGVDPVQALDRFVEVL